MKVVITITEVDCRKPDIQEKVVARIESVSEGERVETEKRGLLVFGQSYELFFTVLRMNMGASFALIRGEDVAVRYGGVISANTHMDFSVGPGQMVEVLIEVR